MRSGGVLLAVLAVVLVVVGSAAGVRAGATPNPKLHVGPASLETDAVAVPARSTLEPISLSAPLYLTFVLDNPNLAALNVFLGEVEDPASPTYHHFLSYAQFVATYAPSTSQVDAVESALAAAGGREVVAAPDRSSVNAVLTAGEVDRLLGVEVVSFGSEAGLTLYTVLGDPTLSTSLSGLISGVDGLSDYATAALDLSVTEAAHARATPVSSSTSFARDNSTGEDWYVGSDYTEAYGAAQLLPGAHSVVNATYPRSVAIATLLVSGQNISNSSDQGNLPPWDPSVVDAYFNGTLNPHWPLPTLTGVPVTIDGTTPPLPGTSGTNVSVNETSPFEVENSLDLEMAGSLAPGSSLYNFYFAASLLTASVTTGDVADYFAADLSEALAYSYAPEHLAAVSCSFGLPDLDDAAWDAELLTAAATGVTIVAASGDQGDAPDSLTGSGDGPWPLWPATDANEVSGALSVGGISFDLTGSPSMFYNGTPLNLTYDPNAGNLTNVSAWYDTLGGPGYYSGTEGGVSTVFPEPSWQLHSAAQPTVVNVTVRQGASSLGRTGPDLAMPANSTLATIAANTTGTVFFEVLQGTSIAAPVVAGMLADVVADDNNGSSGPWSSLGFIDPEVYQFASYFWTHPGASGDPFLDVTSGGNYVFSAAPGWDATTGWGGVEAPLFFAALRNTTLLDYKYSGPTPGLPVTPPSSSGTIPWDVVYAIFAAGIVAAVLLVAFAARPTQPRSPPPSIPWGAQGASAPPPGYRTAMEAQPGATFLCPYCGAIRPSEPVRCPQCGAY